MGVVMALGSRVRGDTLVSGVVWNGALKVHCKITLHLAVWRSRWHKLAIVHIWSMVLILGYDVQQVTDVTPSRVGYVKVWHHNNNDKFIKYDISVLQLFSKPHRYYQNRTFVFDEILRAD